MFFEKDYSAASALSNVNSIVPDKPIDNLTNEKDVGDAGRGTCKLVVVGLNPLCTSINVARFPNSLEIIAMRRLTKLGME